MLPNNVRTIRYVRNYNSLSEHQLVRKWRRRVKRVYAKGYFLLDPKFSAVQNHIIAVLCYEDVYVYICTNKHATL